jgi:hypothetical protein
MKECLAMTASFRKPHAFHPRNDALEQRAAVSSLIAIPGALFASASPPPIDLAPMRAEEGQALTRGEMFVASSAPVRPFRGGTADREPKPADFTLTLQASGLAPNIGLLISPSWHPSDQAPSAAFRGGDPATNQGTASRPSPSGQATNQAGVEDDIRPMTLAPRKADAPGDGPGKDGPLYTLNSSGGSGGSGGTAPDRPPVLTASGGGSGLIQKRDGDNQPIEGANEFANPVPIGSILHVQAESPSPDYQIMSYAWTGGTPHSSYNSDAPVTVVTGAQALGTNVLTDQQGYSFIVDAQPRQYTVSLNVTYANGANGSSTVTFTSVAPTSTLTVTQQGEVNMGLYKDAGDDRLKFGIFIDPPMQIAASVSTNAHSSGDFMFLQIINISYMHFTDTNGQSAYRRNDWDWTSDLISHPQGENFDGSMHDGSSLGYPFRYSGLNPDNPTHYFGWHLPANNIMPTNSSGTPRMSDMPVTPGLPSYQKLAAANSFSTYLMYKPGGGVWIALDAIDWAYSVDGQQVNGNWSANPITDLQPTPRDPIGSAAFPTWVNMSDNYRDHVKNPYRGGTPGAPPV